LARRKMLAAEEHIANRVAELAKRRGTTVFQTVNEMLEHAVRIEEMGIPLKEVVDEREVLEKARKLGFTFAIERLMYELIDLANLRAKDKTSEIWLETGRWYGKYFSSRSKDGIKEFKEAMELLSFGNSEFELKENRSGEISVACVGERLSLVYSDLLSKFMAGVFEAFSYRPIEKEISKGVIRLKFEKLR